MGHRNTPVVIAANVGGTGLFWTGQTWSETYPDAHQYPNIDAARKEAGKTFARGDTFAVANHGQGNECRLPL
jgi:hypothetical protein